VEHLPGSHRNLYPVVLPHFVPPILVQKMVEQFREHLRHALEAEPTCPALPTKLRDRTMSNSNTSATSVEVATSGNRFGRAAG